MLEVEFRRKKKATVLLPIFFFVYDSSDPPPPPFVMAEKGFVRFLTPFRSGGDLTKAEEGREKACGGKFRKPAPRLRVREGKKEKKKPESIARSRVSPPKKSPIPTSRLSTRDPFPRQRKTALDVSPVEASRGENAVCSGTPAIFRLRHIQAEN